MIFISIAILLLLTTALEAQELQKQESVAAPFNAVEAHQAVENLAKQLEENFIYPNIGKSYANMLRSKVASGAYSKFNTAAEFAETVTRDLQAVHPEGHLKLQPPTANASGNANADASARINGVGKFGWLAPEVAYMSYHGFSGNRAEYDRVLSKLREVLDSFSTAKTLIIDARSHLGGGLDDMDVMFSYFFDKPITLVMMDNRLEVEQRGSSPLTNHPTLKKVSSPEGIVRRAHLANPSGKNTSLNKARIFLLTSNKTASAGEHLSLALKRTGRATLIGEKTAGAGHFGRTTALGGGYRAFIPVGRTFDPDTDKGWEQTGIEPHVKVPAEKALDEALKRAGVDRDKAKKALDSFTLN
ncbi:MAG: S41 family peptidase [Acidobacteriota bacterium]|nr:S41 family peptidase [Acidobacteriota bacterium]